MLKLKILASVAVLKPRYPFEVAIEAFDTVLRLLVSFQSRSSYCGQDDQMAMTLVFVQATPP